MYFFYVDESGSRDPSVGTAEAPKSHLYVLLAVGLYERQWHPFNREISKVKLELARKVERASGVRLELADCEVKSNWLRNAKERKQRSQFLHALDDGDRDRLAGTFFNQLAPRHAVVMAVAIDKRHLQAHVSSELLQKKAYELLLERIEQFMAEYHDKHQALIVMDDTGSHLNRAVAMKHAFLQRAGNRHVKFPHIVEYPFFTASELSSGVQLADLLAYNVYRAFRDEDLGYSYFGLLQKHWYRRRAGAALDGLKVWPSPSPLIRLARDWWRAQTTAASPFEGGR